MGLKERFYDRLGFKRVNTIEDMKNNETLIENDIVKVAETGYFYDIKTTGTVALNNGLFAEVKQTTFLQIVTNCINNLSNLTQQFNIHKGTMASTSENGHMSAEDKKKLDSLGNIEINSSVNAEPNTIAERDNRGSLKSTSFKSENLNENRIDGALAFRVNNSTDNEIRFCEDKRAIKAWLEIGIKKVEEKIPFTFTTNGRFQSILITRKNTNDYEYFKLISSEIYYNPIFNKESIALMKIKRAGTYKDIAKIGIIDEYKISIQHEPGVFFGEGLSIIGVKYIPV